MKKLVIAEIIVKDFKQTMVEEGFESFKEMSKCYMWSKSDIVGEMSAILTSAKVDAMYDNGDFECDEGTVSYKEMMSIVRKAI